MDNYKYEVSLSYAHADNEIADIFAKELEDIFVDRFFRDCNCKGELSKADNFKQNLKRIFEDSHYAVILYSHNYIKAEFTTPELEAILDKSKRDGSNNFFIVNLNNTPLSVELEEKYYLKCNLEQSKSKKDIVHGLVHEKIKKCILMDTLETRKLASTYSVNIQTLFDHENVAQWHQKFDWNILTEQYIVSEGRKLKDDYSWQELWEYVRQDFKYIKMELQSQPDILRHIHLNCHLSIAYKLGEGYGDLFTRAGNSNLHLTSSNAWGDSSFDFSVADKEEVGDFCQVSAGNNLDAADMICIVSIKARETPHIVEKVKTAFKNKNLQYGKIVLFQEKMELSSANVLKSLVDYIYTEMQKHKGVGNGGKVHLILDTLAPLAFVLGGKTTFPGKIQLYEYLAKEEDYTPSLTN